jgi:hypothetical protein
MTNLQWLLVFVLFYAIAVFANPIWDALRPEPEGWREVAPTQPSLCTDAEQGRLFYNAEGQSLWICSSAWMPIDGDTDQLQVRTRWIEE